MCVQKKNEGSSSTGHEYVIITKLENHHSITKSNFHPGNENEEFQDFGYNGSFSSHNTLDNFDFLSDVPSGSFSTEEFFHSELFTDIEPGVNFEIPEAAQEDDLENGLPQPATTLPLMHQDRATLEAIFPSSTLLSFLGPDILTSKEV